MKVGRMSVRSQVIIGILLVIVAIYVAVGLFLALATSPRRTVRAQAITVAEKQAGLTKPESFGIATTSHTTYAVTGTKDGQAVGVIIPENGGKLTIVKLSDGVAPSKLKTASTTSVVLGLYQDKPVWQVNSRSGFKIYDFTDGHQLVG